MSWWTKWGRDALKIVGVAVAAYFTGGAALAAYGGEAAAAGGLAAAGTEGALAAGTAGAASGLSAGEAGALLAASGGAAGTASSAAGAASGIGLNLGTASAVGSLASAGLNYYGQQQTNAANAQQASQQMAFQADQTGTAYQRAVKDMQAAGLNPMLAYQNGGAQSGGGAQATMGNALGAGASGAQSAAMTIAQLANLTQTNDNIEAQTNLTRSETALNALRANLIPAQTQSTIASAGQTAAATSNLQADLPRHTAEAEVARRSAEYDIERRKQDTFRAGTEARVAEGSATADIDRRRTEARIAAIRQTLAGLGVNEASSYSDFYGSAAGKAKPYTDYGLESGKGLADIINPLRGTRGFSAKSLSSPPRRNWDHQTDLNTRY